MKYACDNCLPSAVAPLVTPIGTKVDGGRVCEVATELNRALKADATTIPTRATIASLRTFTVSSPESLHVEGCSNGHFLNLRNAGPKVSENYTETSRSGGSLSGLR